MRPQLPENSLLTLLRQCYTAPRCQLRPRPQAQRVHASCQRLSRSSFESQRRAFVTHNGKVGDCESMEGQLVAPAKDGSASNSGRKNTAVIGGGFTEPPAAHYLTSARTPIYDPNRPVHEPRTGEPGKPASAPTTPQNIAILGGGITGLSAAHYLAKELPATKITIYELSDRLGGWLQSRRVDVEKGNVVFESGPRTLRPNTIPGMCTAELVCLFESRVPGILLTCYYMLIDPRSKAHRRTHHYIQVLRCGSKPISLLPRPPC